MLEYKNPYFYYIRGAYRFFFVYISHKVINRSPIIGNDIIKHAFTNPKISAKYKVFLVLRVTIEQKESSKYDELTSSK